ncbi:MAG TPA: carboxypeptidase-like regulatory domain-containing protein, partial [Burkholderiaceae bacterium]|nr:carboxypeptidase-like regulatory domain-containing protein [Burkholderiaceae bacterium]
MNDLHWSRFSRTALSVAVAIVAAAPALAQNTTAAVGGRITTADGKPVAGATVVVRHDESGSVNTLTTDAEGRYAVRGLRVGGPYSVVVTKGADTARRGDIYLQLADSANIDLSIGATTLDRVELTGTATVTKFDSNSTGAGTSLSRKEIDAYASVARNLQDYARIDPRLAQTDKERGEISAMGQNTRFNSITIDGVRINDTFGLESNNLPTAKQPISIDAIQAVQVNLSNYDVTQQGYTGANINAVTKSGTNNYKGSVYYVYRDDRMAGVRYNRTKDTYFQPADFKESTKGFTLGGPIIKDKLFFFTNYEELHSTRSTPSFGPVGSSMTNVGITPEQIAAAIKTAKDKWGIDVGSTDIPAGVELVVKDYLAKFDWNINEKHRANIRFARTEQTEPTFAGFSSTSLSLNSYWWNQKKTIDTVVGQWFADWTEDFSTEFKLSRRTYDSVPE